MKKSLDVKKLYTGLDDDQIKRKSRLTLVCSAVTLIASVAVTVIPQTGLNVMAASYSWAGPMIVAVAVAAFFVSLYCLIGHFASYRLRKEIYASQLSVLKGEWHTFAGLEVQAVLTTAMTALELFMLVRWFDVGTLAASVAETAGTVCAWTVRNVTHKAFSGLSELPPTKRKEAVGSEDVSGVLTDDKKDTEENSHISEETEEFYEK